MILGASWSLPYLYFTLGLHLASQLSLGNNKEISLSINSSAACWENVSALWVSRRICLWLNFLSDLVSELISTLSLWHRSQLRLMYGRQHSQWVILSTEYPLICIIMYWWPLYSQHFKLLSTSCDTRPAGSPSQVLTPNRLTDLCSSWTKVNSDQTAVIILLSYFHYSS